MKPRIKIFYCPPRIINGIECPGGYEAIVTNIHEVETNSPGSVLRHDTPEDAVQDLLKANGWDEHKCEIMIQKLCPEICSGCKNEIDTDTCHCGSSRHFHGYELGHGFVPMGCTCGYVR